MTKPLPLFALLLIFIGLLFGSLALRNEMVREAQPSEDTEPADASVIVTAPAANSAISSPVTVAGKARGTWFFEASFPVEIIDESGTSLGMAPAMTSEDWMTTDYISFSVQVPFAKATTTRGFILLKKDNPSGLPEIDATIAVPVTFSK